jgi:hypothetical protein
VLGGTMFVSATPAAPSYAISGLPPLLCVSVTERQSEPPAGITSGSWLALVLTVNGLPVFAPPDPNVVVHVLPALGIVATNPAQLEVRETPTATLTVSVFVGLPGIQYIVKVQTPAATVCAGSPVHAHVVVIPPAAGCTSQGVARLPGVGLSVLAVQPGAVPEP